MTLKKTHKKVKTYLQNRSKNRSFSKGRPFTSRGLLMQKSVFLTRHVVHSFRVNEKSERSLNFSSSRMPWLCHPKIVYGVLLHGDKTPKNLFVVVVGDRTDRRTHVFKRRPHKMPFGQLRLRGPIFDCIRLAATNDEYFFVCGVSCGAGVAEHGAYRWFPTVSELVYLLSVFCTRSTSGEASRVSSTKVLFDLVPKVWSPDH